MEENPYKAPVESGTGLRFPRLLIFILGAIGLWPASWLLGRGLIPPDDVALRLSVVVYIAALVVWGIYIASRRPVDRRGSVTFRNPER